MVGVPALIYAEARGGLLGVSCGDIGQSFFQCGGIDAAYIDCEGNHASVRLSGWSEEETDEKFQRHVMNEVQKKDVPTVRQFADAVYRPSFMTGLAATTLANYEHYLRKNIMPYMGDMPWIR